MTHEFYLLHRAGPEKFNHLQSQQFSFKTCMRHIVLSDAEQLSAVSDSLLPTDQLFRGDDAYRFILQVICGLHSPLMGETEVYGQFKNAVGSFSCPHSPWGLQLNRLFRALFEDAKKIRNAYLEDLGSQSYGSLLRRELKGMKSVHVLGAGHLAQEILPWMAKAGVSLHVHCRNVEKARHGLGALLDSGQIQLHEIGENLSSHQPQKPAAIVIAAPVSAEWFANWAQGVDVSSVVDLRDTWQSDEILPNLQYKHKVLKLGVMVAKISANQTLLVERKAQALAAIERLIEERSRFVEYRPFGWDDVCA